MACAEPCPDGCDLACERHVTWRPDPRRQHPGFPRLEPAGVRLSAWIETTGTRVIRRRHSTRFLLSPRGDGGGDVQVATLSERGELGIWKTVARKRPFSAEAPCPV